MISFFRKYERTFFLIVFAPTIVGLGVTGVVTQISHSRGGPSVMGKVFGEEVSQVDFQEVAGTYERMLRRDQGSAEDREDSAWRFYTFVKYAEQNGVRVPREEVGKSIADSMKWQIAQMKTMDELEKRGIVRGAPNYEKEFQGELFRQFQLGMNGPLNLDDYTRAIDRMYHMSVHEYEAYKQREAVIQRVFDDFLGAAATASPEEVWKSFEEKFHKREAELIAIKAADHRPTAQTITDDEVKAYFEMNRDLFDQARRVELEFAAAKFDRLKTEAGTPTDAELQAFYDKKKDAFWKETAPVAPVGSPSVAPVASYKAFDKVKSEVALKVIDEKAKDRATALIEKVSKAVADQVKAKQPVNFAAACDAVKAAEKTESLIAGTTGLVEEDAIAEHGVIRSLATLRWFRNEASDRVSDPLQGDFAAFLVRAKKVEPQKDAEWETSKARAKTEFLDPSMKELKRHWQAKQDRYKTEEEVRIDIVMTDLDTVAKHKSTEPKEGELEAWFDKNGAAKFPGKKLADVKADAEKAFRSERAKEESKKGLATLRKLSEDKLRASEDASLGILYNHPSVPSFVDFKAYPMMERAKMQDDPIIKGAASAIIALATQPKNSVGAEVMERADGKGHFIFQVRDRREPRARELEEVKEKVKADVLDERGLERAEKAADKLQRELADLKGDALDKAIAAKKLETKKTGLFDKSATTLPDLPQEIVGRLVPETYATEVGTMAARAIPDPAAGKVWLVHCLRKEPAPDADFAKERATIRKEVLDKNRAETKERLVEDILLKAKSIDDKMVAWIRARRVSPEGALTWKVRQIFVPPDKPTLDAWLDAEAKKVADEVEAAIKGGLKIEGAALKWSEDETSNKVGGLRPRASRNELVMDHGPDFEEKLFRLTPEDGVVRLKSNKGIHIIKVESKENVGPRVFLTYRQVLIKTDPDARKMPKEIKDEADKKAREKIEAAKKRIDGGEPFGVVALDVGSDDMDAKGDAFSAEWTSPFVRAALRQPLQEISAPVEVKDAAGSKWEIFACSPDATDREPVWAARPRAARVVYHIELDSQAEADKVKKELDAKVAEGSSERGSAWPEVVKTFRKIARKRSNAPTKTKGGAFGVVALSPTTRPYGDAFLEKIESAKAGARTEIFRSETGYHLVETIEPEIKPEEAWMRDRRVIDSILRGSDWD